MKLDRKAARRAASVFHGVDLGDTRRTERLVRAMELFAAAPDATLPRAMGSEAETKALYRLLGNGAVEADALNEQHAATTAQRARQAGRVFVIHDTTEFEFSHADPEAVGYARTGQAGFDLHYALVVDATDERRRPLGIANAEALFRETKPNTRRRKKAARKSAAQTILDPERRSLRWSRGFANAARVLEGAAVIHLADREGDNYDLLARAVAAGQRFVIRARVRDRNVRNENGQEKSIGAVMEGCAGMLSRTVPLSSRRPRSEPQANKTHPPRTSRNAQLQFSAASVEVPRPRYHSAELPPTLKLNVVRVYEPKPPDGEKPIEWLLYTTEPASTADEVAAIVDAYRARWLIEECNKAIKSGCKYEERQIESREGLLTLLAMTLPIACEVLWLRSRGRDDPEGAATEVLTPTQIDVLRTLGKRKLGAHPTVHDAVWAVAGLGGHLRNNGEPGWQVLHYGMMKLLAYEEGWLAATRRHGRGRKNVTSR